MDNAKKSALKAAGLTAAVGGAAVLVLGNPVAWAAVALGAYRIGKQAYQKAQDSAKLPPALDENLFI
jgi:hypothetical protein